MSDTFADERNQPKPIHGRGASGNPANRFEALHLEPDPEDEHDPERPARRTIYYRDFTRTIIAHNDSPDVGFESSVNPYRGCEHGCIYCYARPTHEFLGFSAGTRFREPHHGEGRRAANCSRAELSKPRWKPQTLVMSGVTDPYQPVERRLQITRRCLEVLARFRNPVGIITKNQLVTRDIDLLGELAAHQAAAVNISDHLARSQTATRARAAHLRATGAAGGDRGNCVPPACRSG